MEIERVPESRHITLDERRSEEHFDSTNRRNEDGRFVVQMPFKYAPHNLGLSKANAIQRFIRLEYTLHHNADLFRKYSAFIQDFFDLGHLQKIQRGEINNSPNFYLPHHCVLKEDSATTKLRVLFDASARTTFGFSFNDCLLVGPKLQDDLFSILVQIRFFKVALSADVAKMYRQIGLDGADRDFHRIFWRFSADGPVETLPMTRVTYGIASSLYHSIRSLRECAKLSEVPTEVQRAILRDFHVDDILTGGNLIEEAPVLQKQLVEIPN